jgi:hypothetical protein
MTLYGIRHGDAVRYMSVPQELSWPGADGHGHRPQKLLDLRKHQECLALRGQRRIIEAEPLLCRGRNASIGSASLPPDELAFPGVRQSDEGLDEFLADLYASRRASMP